MLYICSMSMLAGNNCVENTNEALEIIKPRMRKVKLPNKLKYFMPRRRMQRGAEPLEEINNSQVYILTLILTICNYTFHILCFISTIIVCFLTPSAIKWIILPISCYFVVETVIFSIFEFQKDKIERKNQGRLDNDFTITKGTENDNSDEISESVTDKQDKRE